MLGNLEKSTFKPEENYDQFYQGHKFEPFPEDFVLDAHKLVPRVAWAVDVAKEIGAKNCLDLCCLDGFASLTLSKQLGIEVMGVDLSEPGIHLAQVRAREYGLKAAYFQNPIEDLTLENEYDLILLFEAIEHFTDVDKVMEVIKRALKPGGTLLVSTPDAEGKFGIVNTEDVCHLRCYSTREDITDIDQDLLKGAVKPTISLPKYLEEQGFKVVENEVWSELAHVRAILE